MRPEREEAFRLIDERPNGCLIDPIILYSMCALAVQDVLAAVLRSIGIARSTVGLFDTLLAERKHFESGGFLSMGKQGEDFVRHEVAEDAVKENTRRIEAASAWARERCTVVPSVGAGDPPPEWLQLFENMDESFSDTLLAASGSRRTLLCDDQRLRSEGKEAFQCEGVWLHPVLTKALERRLMAKDRYAEVVEDLEYRAATPSRP
jgi:hypothetical protein